MTENRSPTTVASIREWQQAVHKLAIDKGWWDAPTVEQKARTADLATLALMYWQLSQHAEAVREGVPLVESLGTGPQTLHEVWIAAGRLKDQMVERYHNGDTLIDMLAKIALAQGELSEAAECVMSNDIQYREDEDGKPQGAVTEIGDAIVRCWDLTCRYALDIATVIWKKHRYNQTRSYRHGKVV